VHPLENMVLLGGEFNIKGCSPVGSALSQSREVL
jgi:hypothetical protein